MEIVGFTKVVALAMARYSVAGKCIFLFAWTRMIGAIPTDTEEEKKRVEKMEKMSPAHIALLLACLTSDEAQDISEQIFGVRGKENFLFSQPRPIRSIHHWEGWKAERLSKILKGRLDPSLVPLQTSPQVFSYDTLV